MSLDGVTERIRTLRRSRSWFESRSRRFWLGGPDDNTPCECDGTHGSLRSCRTRCESSAGHITAVQDSECRRQEDPPTPDPSPARGEGGRVLAYEAPVQQA